MCTSVCFHPVLLSHCCFAFGLGPQPKLVLVEVAGTRQRVCGDDESPIVPADTDVLLFVCMQLVHKLMASRERFQRLIPEYSAKMITAFGVKSNPGSPRSLV